MKAVVRVQASGPSCLEDQDDLVTHTVMRKTEIKMWARTYLPLLKNPTARSL